MSLKQIMVLNGPNLNCLGQREPQHYGHETLADIETALGGLAKELKLQVDCRQTNHEGVLVDWLQEIAQTSYHGLIINAGAYTHTSIAIADALRLLSIPIIEVHLSNIYQREAFRHHSFIAPLARGQISGLGSQGYLLALRYLAQVLAH